MATYSHDGAAHAILRRLAEGSARFERLQALACRASAHDPAKVKYLVRAMVADDLIVAADIGYRITSFGRNGLAELDQGRDFTAEDVPSVRAFRREVA